MTELFDKKDVFSWSNTGDAFCYLGMDGYFANTLVALENAINLGKTHTLKLINTAHGLSFRADNRSQYAFFLPTDKVKKPEKKWRSFKSWEEFRSVTGLDVGSPIIIQNKVDLGIPYEVRLISMIRVLKTETRIGLSGLGSLYSFADLFEKYNFKLTELSEWQPFGVLEND